MIAEFSIAKAVAQLEAQSLPAWFRDWQQLGREQLAAQSWPTRKTENWKYTSLRSLQNIDWESAKEVTRTNGVSFTEWNEIKVNIINGKVSADIELPAGVSLRKLTDLDQESGQRLLDRLDAERSGFLFDDVNQALADQILWLSVDRGVEVKQPIHFNYVTYGDNVVDSYQVVVDVADRAKLTFAETFSYEGDGAALINPATALFVSASAQLTHYHLLLEEGDVRHIGRVSATLENHAQLTAFHMASGGTVKRKDIVVRHRGEGAELSLNGVYLPTAKQVIDYHTTLEHEVPHCTSQEVFRGIIGDHAKAVFNGRIHIHKDAQKSVAELNNRNLLLSPNAEINTKPELEIYADDVRCAHGATIAQLDEKELFYFQARGISRAEAEVMLSFGFINELIDGLKDEPVQALLRPMLASIFSSKKPDLVRHLNEF